MRLVPLLLLAAGLLAGADLREARIDLKSEELEGTWILQTVEWLGEQADQLWEWDLGPSWGGCVEARELHRPVVTDRMTITFQNHKFITRQISRPGCGFLPRPGTWEGLYETDRTKQPQILKTYLSDAMHLDWREKPSYSIFGVQRDMLKLCFRWNDGDGRPLPRTFATDKDEDVYLLTFHRSKP
jgi:hypothetical protein